jgi:hypothetical protein
MGVWVFKTEMPVAVTIVRSCAHAVHLHRQLIDNEVENTDHWFEKPNIAYLFSLVKPLEAALTHSDAS